MTDENEPMLCSNCVSDPRLSRRVEEIGLPHEGSCRVCGASATKLLNPACNPLNLHFRALIRYHFSEWTYNHHWGGGSLEALFLQENPILNWGSVISEDDLLDAVNILLDEVYQDFETGISMYAGYGPEGEQLELLKAMKSDVDSRLMSFADRLEGQNHFELESEALALLAPLRRALLVDLNEGQSFYRARVGVADSATPLHGWSEEWHYRPHEGIGISSPPPRIASGGRMNRVGVSFIYLSSNRDTAVAEVRPHPGHYVSTGEFRSKKRMEIANLKAIEIAEYCESDAKLTSFHLLKNIEGLFSAPITPDERHKYSLTQFIADCFRLLGFDGVSYASSLTGHTNYVFFVPREFQYVEGSGAVHKIKSVSYASEEMQLIGDESDYLTRPNGDFLAQNDLIKLISGGD